jgi:hypothetical protein
MKDLFVFGLAALLIAVVAQHQTIPTRKSPAAHVAGRRKSTHRRLGRSPAS